MMHKTVGIVALLWVASLLAGCGMGMQVKVEPDGSGEFSTIMKYTQDEASMLEQGMKQNGASVSQDLCTSLKSLEGLSNSKVFNRKEKHGDETWCILGVRYSNLEEMRADLSGEGIIVNRLEMRDGRFFFDLTLVPSSGASSRGTEMPSFIVVTFELVLPGDAVSYNADQVDGYKLIWNVGATDSRRLMAESLLNKKAGSNNLVVWLVGAAVVLGVLILAVLLFKELRPRPVPRRQPLADEFPGFKNIPGPPPSA